MRALVVDDSGAGRGIVTRVLRGLGFECVEAGGGADALEAIAREPRPTLVTVTRQLPGMDGLELTRRIRQAPHGRELKVVMFSSDADPARQDEARTAGADAYVVKPFTSDSLGRALASLGLVQPPASAAATASTPIRVLVVDDSSTIRTLLTATLGEDPGIKVIGTAVNGRMAVDIVTTSPPDLVLLDVEMPVLDGLSALREIRRANKRLPVIMFSSLTERGTAVTLDALLAGANDYAAKPSGLRPEDLSAKIREELVAKIKALVPRSAPPAVAPPPPRPAAAPARADVVRGVVIGVSTGGPAALAEILPHFASRATAPVLIVQHMPASFMPHLAERLAKISGAAVREAVDGAPLRAGDVLLAPGGRHLTVCGDRDHPRVRLTDDPLENACRPAADALFRTAAQVWGAGTLGIVLTGMGRDGLAGSRAVVDAGGDVLAQDAATSVVWGMPGEVAKAGLAQMVLPLARIGPEIAARLKCAAT